MSRIALAHLLLSAVLLLCPGPARGGQKGWAKEVSCQALGHHFWIRYAPDIGLTADKTLDLPPVTSCSGPLSTLALAMHLLATVDDADPARRSLPLDQPKWYRFVRDNIRETRLEDCSSTGSLAFMELGAGHGRLKLCTGLLERVGPEYLAGALVHEARHAENNSTHIPCTRAQVRESEVMDPGGAYCDESYPGSGAYSAMIDYYRWLVDESDENRGMDDAPLEKRGERRLIQARPLVLQTMKESPPVLEKTLFNLLNDNEIDAYLYSFNRTRYAGRRMELEGLAEEQWFQAASWAPVNRISRKGDILVLRLDNRRADAALGVLLAGHLYNANEKKIRAVSVNILNQAFNRLDPAELPELRRIFGSKVGVREPDMGRGE